MNPKQINIMLFSTSELFRPASCQWVYCLSPPFRALCSKLMTSLQSNIPETFADKTFAGIDWKHHLCMCLLLIRITTPKFISHSDIMAADLAEWLICICIPWIAGFVCVWLCLHICARTSISMHFRSYQVRAYASVLVQMHRQVCAKCVFACRSEYVL